MSSWASWSIANTLLKKLLGTTLIYLTTLRKHIGSTSIDIVP